MLSVLAAAALGAKHHGVYVDPNHYVPGTYAGVRFIGEDAHALGMVGTDDGATWFKLPGMCSGPLMANITFDFSPKGGPANFTGVAEDLADGGAQIVWEDGNVWTWMGSSPSSLLTVTNTHEKVAERKDSAQRHLSASDVSA